MKRVSKGDYTAPIVCVANCESASCLAASGDTENSGSTPGVFDMGNWSDQPFKF